MSSYELRGAHFRHSREEKFSLEETCSPRRSCELIRDHFPAARGSPAFAPHIKEIQWGIVSAGPQSIVDRLRPGCGRTVSQEDEKPCAEDHRIPQTAARFA